MTERKEKIMPTKIAFFDADKTLWKVVTTDGSDDWASKIKNPTFVLNNKHSVTRKENGTEFILKEGVQETLKKLSEEGIGVGIISDNEYDDVIKLINLFGISEDFDPKLTNIILWKGQADKAEMISDVLGAQSNIDNNHVLLIDDSPTYAEQMKKYKYNFIQSPKDSFPKDLIFQFFGIK